MIALALSFLTGKLAAALRWIFSSPTAALGTLCAILAIVGLMEHRRADSAEARAKSAKAALSAAISQAEATRLAAEANYRSMAHAADNSYQAGRADGSAKLAAYIAAHRLRPSPAHPASPAQGASSGLPEKPTPSPIVETVVISEADIKTCDVLYDYAKASHGWAQELKGSNDGS